MLNKGIVCGVGTSTHTEEAQERLHQHGIHGRFATVVGRDRVRRGKPDPEIFLAVAGELGHPPERALVFEDAHSGVRAAQAGGMSVIPIPDLLPASETIASLCSAVLPSLLHARDWLDDGLLRKEPPESP